jgi:hypothetical protein
MPYYEKKGTQSVVVHGAGDATTTTSLNDECEQYQTQPQLTPIIAIIQEKGTQWRVPLLGLVFKPCKSNKIEESLVRATELRREPISLTASQPAVVVDDQSSYCRESCISPYTSPTRNWDGGIGKHRHQWHSGVEENRSSIINRQRIHEEDLDTSEHSNKHPKLGPRTKAIRHNKTQKRPRAFIREKEAMDDIEWDEWNGMGQGGKLGNTSSR